MHALVNEGAGAGASLAHSHSQLVWLEEEPPLVAQERELQAEAVGCLVCEMLAQEREHRLRIVDERDGIVLLCPYAGRQPYELLVAPLECEADPFTSDDLAGALALAAEGIRRLRIAEGPVPFNLWLHAAGHWHLEILPRFGVLAGLELGAGYFVNTMAPEAAARRAARVLVPAWDSWRLGGLEALRRLDRRLEQRPLSLPCLISITVSTASIS